MHRIPFVLQEEEVGRAIVANQLRLALKGRSISCKLSSTSGIEQALLSIWRYAQNGHATKRTAEAVAKRLATMLSDHRPQHKAAKKWTLRLVADGSKAQIGSETYDTNFEQTCFVPSLAIVINTLQSLADSSVNNANDSCTTTMAGDDPQSNMNEVKTLKAATDNFLREVYHLTDFGFEEFGNLVVQCTSIEKILTAVVQHESDNLLSFFFIKVLGIMPEKILSVLTRKHTKLLKNRKMSKTLAVIQDVMRQFEHPAIDYTVPPSSSPRAPSFSSSSSPQTNPPSSRDSKTLQRANRIATPVSPGVMVAYCTEVESSNTMGTVGTVGTLGVGVGLITARFDESDSFHIRKWTSSAASLIDGPWHQSQQLGSVATADILCAGFSLGMGGQLPSHVRDTINEQLAGLSPCCSNTIPTISQSCLIGQTKAVERVQSVLQRHLHAAQARVGRPTIICIAGPSGSGRTTLVNHMAAALFPPDSNLQVHTLRCFRTFSLRDCRYSNGANHHDGFNRIALDLIDNFMDAVQRSESHRKTSQFRNEAAHTSILVTLRDIEACPALVDRLLEVASLNADFHSMVLVLIATLPARQVKPENRNEERKEANAILQTIGLQHKTIDAVWDYIRLVEVDENAGRQIVLARLSAAEVDLQTEFGIQSVRLSFINELMSIWNLAQDGHAVCSTVASLVRALREAIVSFVTDHSKVVDLSLTVSFADNNQFHIQNRTEAPVPLPTGMQQSMYDGNSYLVELVDRLSKALQDKRGSVVEDISATIAGLSSTGIKMLNTHLKQNNQLLQKAIKSGAPEMVGALVGIAGISINHSPVVDETDPTLSLVCSTQTDDTAYEMLQLFLKRYLGTEEVKRDVLIKTDVHGKTPLQWAVLRYMPKTIRVLLEHRLRGTDEWPLLEQSVVLPDLPYSIIEAFIDHATLEELVKLYRGYMAQELHCEKNHLERISRLLSLSLARAGTIGSGTSSPNQQKEAFLSALFKRGHIFVNAFRERVCSACVRMLLEFTASVNNSPNRRVISSLIDRHHKFNNVESFPLAHQQFTESISLLTTAGFVAKRKIPCAPCEQATKATRQLSDSESQKRSLSPSSSSSSSSNSKRQKMDNTAADSSVRMQNGKGGAKRKDETMCIERGCYSLKKVTKSDNPKASKRCEKHTCGFFPKCKSRSEPDGRCKNDSHRMPDGKPACTKYCRRVARQLLGRERYENTCGLPHPSGAAKVEVGSPDPKKAVTEQPVRVNDAPLTDAGLDGAHSTSDEAVDGECDQQDEQHDSDETDEQDADEGSEDGSTTQVVKRGREVQHSDDEEDGAKKKKKKRTRKAAEDNNHRIKKKVRKERRVEAQEAEENDHEEEAEEEAEEHRSKKNVA